MKLSLYLSDAQSFCKGNPFFAVREAGDADREFIAEYMPQYMFITEFDFDETLIDSGKVLAAAVANLDEAERAVKAEYAIKCQEIENRRGELLALEHQP